MGKGTNEETCAELTEGAIKKLGSPCDADKLFKEVKSKWGGKDSTIWQHLMSRVVNLPPAYRQWPRPKIRFLLLREDGQYELYNPCKHGTYRNGAKSPLT